MHRTRRHKRQGSPQRLLYSKCYRFFSEIIVERARTEAKTCGEEGTRRVLCCTVLVAMADCIVIDDSSDEETPLPTSTVTKIAIPILREVTVTPAVVPITDKPALTITPVIASKANTDTENIMSVDLSSSDEKEDENEPVKPKPAKESNEADPKSSRQIVETTETLDFAELKLALDKASEQTCVVRAKAKGPVCCNSWCTKPASICPGDHIRDYYNIPSGKNFKLCDDCVEQYYKFMKTAERNLETNGDLLEGWFTGFNEFIVLEGESDEEDEECDPEIEKLLQAAIKETIHQIDIEYDLKKIVKENTKRVCDKIENSISESKQIVKRLGGIEMEMYRDLEGFKQAFRPPHLSLADLDVPYSEPEPVVINVTGDETFEDVPEPSTLPPFGELVRPPPNVGNTFYAMKDLHYSEWIPFQIVKIVCEPDEFGNFIDTYTVETALPHGTSGSHRLHRRVVNGDHLAYTNVAQVRLGIGTRVLGAFNRNGSAGSRKVWYSGMIAEYPTGVNQYRYLVFFDDGKVQYCPHEDLRVIYKTSQEIHEYFTGFNVEFVQSYLKNFPDRAMVKTNTEHYLRVEKDGFWISGKVDKLDASLVRVTFTSDKLSEWIYRGSPRLRPVFEKLQADLRNPITSTLPIIRHVNNRVPQFAGQIIIDSSDEDEDRVYRQKRAVAKKSTARPIEVRPVYNVVKRPEKRVTRASVVQRFPPVTLTPKMFRWHKCSYACVTWVEYKEDKTRGVNPLAIPSMFAFKREIDVTSSVTYTAPCGKRLKNIQEVLKYLSETLIPLTLDMFDFDIRTQIFDEFVVNESFVLMEDISYGEERNPIACVNEVDNSCPDLMNYMTERRPLEGVHINLDPGFLVCCDCTDNCRDRSKCRCWRLTIDNFKPFNVGEEKRHITKVGYQYQRLDQNVLSGIYECNSQCSCNKVTCINRVVQHPTRHKLQLFKTTKKGWGTRTLNDIPQGVFISTYVGNILTEPKANETGTINGDEYFAELDHIEVMAGTKANFEARAAKMTDEEDEDEDDPGPVPAPERRTGSRAVRSCTRNASNKRNPKRPEPMAISDEDGGSDSDDEDSIRKFYGPDETVYVMDAKIAGNIGRYFNHSCDPNIFVQNVYVDTHDLRFPWVAFFALRHIPAGTELTWDYRYRIGSVPGKVLYCYCGASNCRKRLL